MASGGARNRSGPAPDPSSGRSDRRGLSFTALPAEGFTGPVPDFPLPGCTDRELEVWESLWRTPQAAAWATAAWRWQAIGELVRLQVRAEAQDSPATLFERIRQWRADLGLTPAGLKENGWAIAADEVTARREDRDEASDEPYLAPVRRLRG
ncbi:MAG: hypothetical protein K0S70_197 [Microbacterium sp.]|nr:hypothetical protein [Microbacterium sp.]